MQQKRNTSSYVPYILVYLLTAHVPKFPFIFPLLNLICAYNGHHSARMHSQCRCARETNVEMRRREREGKMHRWVHRKFFRAKSVVRLFRNVYFYRKNVRMFTLCRGYLGVVCDFPILVYFRSEWIQLDESNIISEVLRWDRCQ